MDLLNKLRTIAEDYAKKNEDEKYKIIKAILSEDNCFFKISPETALNILEDLGFKKEEGKEIYKHLISPESYLGTFKKVK